MYEEIVLTSDDDAYIAMFYTRHEWAYGDTPSEALHNLADNMDKQ